MSGRLTRIRRLTRHHRCPARLLAVHWCRTASHASRRGSSSGRSTAHRRLCISDTGHTGSLTPGSLVREPGRILRFESVAQLGHAWNDRLIKLVSSRKDFDRLSRKPRLHQTTKAKTHPFLDLSTILRSAVQETQLDVSWSRTIDGESVHTSTRVSLDVVFQIGFCHERPFPATKCATHQAHPLVGTFRAVALRPTFSLSP